jgi:hypothetical protein
MSADYPPGPLAGLAAGRIQDDIDLAHLPLEGDGGVVDELVNGPPMLPQSMRGAATPWSVGRSSIPSGPPSRPCLRGSGR